MGRGMAWEQPQTPRGTRSPVLLATHLPLSFLPKALGGMGLPLRLVGGIPQGHVPWEPGVVLG